MKLLIFILFLLITLSSFSQTKYDTTIRKKYIDSLKYQLSSYTMMSYNHLNMYDRAAHERDSVMRVLNYNNNYITRLRKQHYKTNINTGIAVLGLMVLSFVAVIQLSK